MVLLTIVAIVSASVGLLVALGVVRGWPAKDLRSRFMPDATRAFVLALAAAVLTAVAVLIGSLIYLLRAWPRVAATDLSVARWAAGHATGLSSAALRVVTGMGSTVVVVLAGSAVAILVALRSRRVVPILFIAFVLVGQSLIVHLIKVLVGRPRPSIAVLTGYSGQSFPSGHSAAAAACWGAIAIVLARRTSTGVRAIAYGAAAGVAVAVACSRVFLGVHWTSDVLAGLSVGWAWLAFCTICFGGRLLLAPAGKHSVPALPAEGEGSTVGVDEGVVHQAAPGTHPPADGRRAVHAEPPWRP